MLLLQPLQCWETLEADLATASGGLPCASCPSDHLPVAAKFAPRQPPSLPAAAVAELHAAVEALVQKQAADKAALEAKLDTRAPPPAAAAALPPVTVEPPTESVAAGGGKQKKKKQKKQKPSAEMITFLQERRAALNTLKEAAKQERSALLGSLTSELERDAVFELVAGGGGGGVSRKSIKDWVELG